METSPLLLRLCLLRRWREEADVLGADVVGGEEAEKRRALAGGFNGGATIGFFALDEADGGEDFQACFARGLDALDGGSAGGAYVVDDED